jgi:hypothetical protein
MFVGERIQADAPFSGLVNLPRDPSKYMDEASMAAELICKVRNYKKSWRLEI